MKILVTGATGKVGRYLVDALLTSGRLAGAEVVALCHSRLLPHQPRLQIIRGSIGDSATVVRALDGVTHVYHLATVKETQEAFIDISIKGLFNLLEGARDCPTLRQLILVGGDAAVGHCMVEHKDPVTEMTAHSAYPGVYALSKVMEEVMVHQYRDQYGLPTTIMRAPWIMEKDDFRYALSFGPDQFGGPSWDDLLAPGEREAYASNNRAPVLIDARGQPLLRNFIHVSDLVTALIAAADNPHAIGQLFNIAMTYPVDYGDLGEFLEQAYGMRPVRIKTSFYSNTLANAKARQWLRWRPVVEMTDLAKAAFEYQRPSGEPRTVWYPG